MAKTRTTRASSSKPTAKKVAAAAASKPSAAGARKQKANAAARSTERLPQAIINKKPNRAPTDFESRLYQACSSIPRGKVSTYGTLAKLLGSAPRAVGQGMRRNPYAPIVPCHRVVAADLSLGGFCGHWGEHTSEVQRKNRMLTEEGVVVQGMQVAPESVISAAELDKLIKKAPAFTPPVIPSVAPPVA